MKAAFVPLSPKVVWEHRQGDCKDMAVLLGTFLHQAGIQTWPVLMTPLNLKEELPNPFIFSHALLKIETKKGVALLDPQLGDISYEPYLESHFLELCPLW